MEIKEIKSLPVYYKQVRTTLKEIDKYVGNMPAHVAEEAMEKGLKIVGPQIWNYNGADGNPDTEFSIDICFPIEQVQDLNGSETKFLEDFKAACYILKGPWSELPNAYSVLLAEMSKQGLQPSASCREVYHLCDFNDQNNCITEIQMGIQ